MFAIDEFHPGRPDLGCASALGSIYEGNHRSFAGSAENLATRMNPCAFIIQTQTHKYCIDR
jgi:hypothetical protein